MTDQVLRIALIGCGRIAGHHCRSIAEVASIELAAICDLEPERMEEHANEFNLPRFTSYREMFADMPDIDAAAVITPSGMHLEHGIEVLSEFGKHVIIEKPTFMRPSQLIQAYEVADAAGLRIFPVLQNRHNKAVRRVKRALDEGELGEVRVVSVRVRWCRPQRYYDMAPWRGTFSHDGGALTNQAIHQLDLIRYLGGPVAKVNATMRTLGADIEVEDTVAATLAFEGGAVGTVEVTTAARPDDFEASISIVGSKGLAQIGGIAVNELHVFTPEPEACPAHSEDFQGIKGHGAVYGYGHTQMYKDIIAHFKDGAAYPIGREDCLGTLRLLHAFYRSDETQGWVDVECEEESQRLGRADEAISDLYRTARR